MRIRIYHKPAPCLLRHPHHVAVGAVVPRACGYLERNPVLRGRARIVERHEPRVGEHIDIIAVAGGAVRPRGDRLQDRLAVNNDDIGAKISWCFQ